MDELEFYLETPAQWQILVLLISITKEEQRTLLYQNKRVFFKFLKLIAHN